MLKKMKAPRNPSYIIYSADILLMTRILSSIFYISSMRKTSEEFNSDAVIKNIGYIFQEPTLSELLHWETINRYLERLAEEEMQRIVNQLTARLLYSRAFENARIRQKYWQINIDGTQLHSNTRALDKKSSMFRTHNKGRESEYTEYYVYLLEAKVVLYEKIHVSIMTEFVENEGKEMEKQDCERKACWRLMERLKKPFLGFRCVYVGIVCIHARVFSKDAERTGGAM